MSNLRQSLIPFAGLALAVGLIITVRPVPTEGRPGDKPASDVNVVNTPTVNAKQSGPWSVGINPTENTVKVDSSTPIVVRAVEQPYSVYLTANNLNSLSETCIDIPVPEGRRLVLETVAVDADFNPSLVSAPGAHVLMIINNRGMKSFNRLAIPFTLPPSLQTNSGHLQTRLLSGGVTVGDGTVTFSLCAGTGTSISGYVVGSLLPQ